MLKIDKYIRDSLISDSISERIWEYDLTTGETNIVYSLIDYLGYTKAECKLQIDFLFTLIHPDDIQDLANALDEAIKDKNGHFKAEYRIKAKNDTYMSIKSSGKILKDENGKSIYIAGVHLDIKPYKQTEIEDELREVNERNKKIINLTPLGVYIVKDGIILYANKPGIELFGAVSEQEIIGKPRLHFLTDYYQNNAILREAKICEGKKVESVIEMELLKLDGNKIIGEVYSVPLPCIDGLISLTFIKDITESKRVIEENKRLLKQTIECDRLKTEFFGNISHELRTPLNIILSGIQLLNSINKNSEDNYNEFITSFEKYSGIIRQNAYRLLKLMNNIIDLTKIDAGFSEIKLKNQDIVAVVEDITLSVADYIKDKGIELIFDTDTEEKIIACNDEKIERIMLNLLSNAVKYTSSGGTIKVDLKDLKTKVRISVKDTGIGIPSDKLEVIFERFRQGGELLNRRAEGSGIGLSLVKSLVMDQGGTISVSSTKGSGSEFVILLPSKTVENTQTDDKIFNIIHDDQLENQVEKINIEFSDIYK